MMRCPPRSQHRPRQRDQGGCADDQMGGYSGGRRDCATRVGIGLRKCRDHGAVTASLRAAGGRQAVTRTGAADRHEYRLRRGARKQELETAYFVAAALVFTLEPQRLQSERARERRLLVQWCRPLGETARREGGAYLWPTQRSDPCKSPPITSVMRREPPANARAIRSAEPPRLPIRNSTRR